MRAAFVFAAALVLLVVVPAVVSGLRPGRDAELGYGDRVPTVQPGFEAIDNTPTHPPGVKRVRAASATKTSSKAWVYPTDELLYALAGCETGGRYDNPNTGNGYFGFFQFDLGTWREVGGTGYPHEHPYEVQRDLARALILKPDGGWGRFPHCSRAIGAR